MTEKRKQQQGSGIQVTREKEEKEHIPGIGSNKNKGIKHKNTD